MTAIRRVTVTVETTDGNTYTETTEGSLNGGNPRYAVRQFRQLTSILTARLRVVLTARHGDIDEGSDSK